MNEMMKMVLRDKITKIVYKNRNDLPIALVEDIEKLVMEERKRALDIAHGFILGGRVGERPKLVINEEMYTRLIDGELEEALKREFGEENV